MKPRADLVSSWPWPQRLKFWFALQDGVWALPILAAIGVAVGIFLAVMTWPLGPPQTTEGEITHFGIIDTELGSRPVATVRVDGTVHHMGLPVNHVCEVGDVVPLHRQKHLWGHSVRFRGSRHSC